MGKIVTDIDLKQKFSSLPRNEKDCWIWVGCKDKDGYGKITYKAKDCRAHRESYRVFNGPISRGMIICHTCDNPSCVNPKHLWLGTHEDNVRDMYNKGRNNPNMGNSLKVSKPDVERIRRLLEETSLTQKEIAELFNVNQITISRIFRRTRGYE